MDTRTYGRVGVLRLIMEELCGFVSAEGIEPSTYWLRGSGIGLPRIV
jgi:hypothetical protein